MKRVVVSLPFVFAITIVLLFGCGPETKQGRNETARLEAEIDGCKIWSFQSHGGNRVYFAKCGGAATQTMYHYGKGQTLMVIADENADTQKH